MNALTDIWIFNPFDNLPEEGVRRQRYAMLSKSLVRAGFNVVWWTGRFRHATKTFRRAPFEYTNADGVRMRLLPTCPYGKNISLTRILSHRKIANSWLKQGLAEVKNGTLAKPGIIITSLPPLSSARAARVFRKKWGCRWIIDIQDAWPETFYQVLPAFCRKIHLLLPLEFSARNMIRDADAVIAVSGAYCKWAESCGASGVLEARIGIEFDENAKSPPPKNYTSPKILYLGNMGNSYDLKTVVGTCARHGWELHLAGAGEQEPELKKFSKGCSNIHFHGFLDYDQLIRLGMSCNIAIIPMFDRSQVAIPNKIADYAMMGLPIVNSLSGETRQLIEQHDAGAFYHAGNGDSFASAVKSIRSEHAINALEMGRSEFDAHAIYRRIIDFIDAIPIIEPQAPDRHLFVKRLFDLLLTLTTAPFWLAAIALIAMVSLIVQGRPVFFLQNRPGYQCRIFKIIKFRTMRDGDGSDGERMTAWGSFLRRSSLDELPELINVLKGEMSLVGPRPLLVRYLDRYSDEQLRRQELPPGITGWAQINGRNAISWKEKFSLDVWYVDHHSFLLDLKILLKTFFSVAKRQGISHGNEATMPEFTGEE